LRVACFGLRVARFEFRVACFGLRVARFEFRVACNGLRVARYGFQNSWSILVYIISDTCKTKNLLPILATTPHLATRILYLLSSTFHPKPKAKCRMPFFITHNTPRTPHPATRNAHPATRNAHPAPRLHEQHLSNGGPGRYHGVNPFFFFHDEIHDHRFGDGKAFGQDRLDF